ncbi:bifunctional DNA-formamidopyrimidine glycosylase/DNA-(apurinic or apyrimidinic site) lyase [Bdellovibrio reynosensis]|uniref:Formamidopyrimidine-DNA glycosylase n=1 Tax=Bdellovibrio reynosensis TaxID=2835041 RepID=A0ABY4CE89_9BACT|nr:bifunctional DNA-formamidopyrimidine glycosylase/DNA-(apurinic or apyrimidinic site) lyase [Bdellovibrio reynosensis]UOF01858.1 bifunctional DNA-formamidopyrimidine glycosylase/DNA-(apurinic or apyrimidinic site) lyase [Bdellovibrio reynosensis]
MPELPEVEVVRRGLESILKDQPVLEKIELKRADLRDPIPAKKLKTLLGEKLLSVERRAKYLLLWTKKGAMLSHLGMTGTWRVAPPGDERLHDHIYLHFSGNLRLAYRDPRRFGCFDFVQKEKTHPKLDILGPEPLEKAFTGRSLWESLRNKNVAIKVAIMDQKVVVGVGNIYASEALFASGIKPALPASKLSLERAERLVKEIKKVLNRSIKNGGSSISDFAQASGESGYFQNTFRVYDRAGEDCVACGQQVKAKVMGGRNTFWCSGCQK